jgi:type II secretory pathway predicted ATPase ExeA
MYEKFFGLDQRPFDLTPNPKYLFLTASHREALSNLDYGITAGTGVTVLVGEAGTGKTTLIRAALESRKTGKTHAVYLNNPTLTRAELLEFLAREFTLGPDAAASKTRLLEKLEIELRRAYAEGVTTTLVIDEAQSLPHDLLEEIRLLANIETATEKLLPIVLAGQPELAERLNHQSLRQLKQRVGLRCQLRPLDLSETGQYIIARVAVAGGKAATIFTREAVHLIYEHSRGIPRTVSVICHNAMISAFAMNRKPITADVIREVCDDFDLPGGDTRSTGAVPSFPNLVSSRKNDEPEEPASTPQGTTDAQTGELRTRDFFGTAVAPLRRFFSL